MPDISVIVPVYNERDSLEPLVVGLQHALSGLNRSYEVLLVDDGSTDGSWERMVELAGRHPQLHLIRLRRNFGQTAALSAGFDRARGQVIVTLDADLQNDPDDIPRLVAKIEEGYDVVSGWRRKRRDPWLTRRLPSRLANALISRSTSVRLHDYGCTLKAYRREIVQNVQLYGEMHRFIPALASWVGGRIAEVEVAHHPRRFGQSKYGLTRTFRVILDLLTVKFLLRYSSGPMQLFGKIAALFLVPAVLLLAVVAVDRILGLSQPYLLKRPFWIITPLMLISFAIQFLGLGLLAELQIRTYHESQQKPIYVVRQTLPPQSDTVENGVQNNV